MDRHGHGEDRHQPPRPPWVTQRGGEGFRAVQSVLDLDPELGEDLGPDTRRIARAAAVAVTVKPEIGEARLDPWLRRAGSGPGLLVVNGVLVSNLSVGDRIAAELLGAGDVLSPPPEDDDQLLGHTLGWRILVPTTLALLDEPFAKRIRFWPAITATLLRRAAQRTSELNVQRAIAAQPRLEVRLTLLLWHLSGRWGKVETGGIRLPLPLTHHLLGRLVAAERPSVSHALARLAQAGLITGHGDEWHLHGTLSDHLDVLGDRSHGVVGTLAMVPRGIAARA